MSEKKPFDWPDKLNVDDKNKFHLHLPTGEEKIIELTNEEIETVENWAALYGKHPIRYEIETLLQIHDKLNATQISHLVRQSKATVARHLRAMEEDGLLKSEMPYEYDQGRIPPKFYRINKKLLQVVQNRDLQRIQPNNPKKLRAFYQREIYIYRTIINQFISLINKMNPLLDMFEDQLEDLNIAKQTYADYFDINTTKNYPVIGYNYVSEKYIDRFYEIFVEYGEKLRDLFAIQNTDPEVKEKEYEAFWVSLPIKSLYDIYRKRVLEEN